MKQSPFRYSWLEKTAKVVYRKINPVPVSPYTLGEVKDICAVHLVPPEKLNTFFTRAFTLLKKRRGENIGDYLEFGVFNGASLSSAYSTAKNEKLQIRFVGFDAFEGLPEESEGEDDGVWKKGFYTCSFEQMQICLKKTGINPGAIIWVKGWYNETLTKQLQEKEQFNPGLVFIDCDTYSSSKAVLDFIGPLICAPTIICLDDWKLYDLDVKGMGEYKSFNEFIESHPNLIFTEIASYNRKSKSFLVSPK